jgi:hypothetical protein
MKMNGFKIKTDYTHRMYLEVPYTTYLPTTLTLKLLSGSRREAARCVMDEYVAFGALSVSVLCLCRHCPNPCIALIWRFIDCESDAEPEITTRVSLFG